MHKELKVSKKQVIKEALVASGPVMPAYIVLAVAYSIIMRSKGLGLFWSVLMSLIVYAGSMQFVAVGLLTSLASPLTVALTTLMVNARHLFYGLSMLDRYQSAGPKKPYLIFALTDETYSLLAGERQPAPGEDRTDYYFWVSLFNHSYWVIGTIIGALLGNLVKFDTTGTDFALTALFISIFIDQWQATQDHLAAVMGLVLSISCLAIFGPDSFLIPTMFAILIGLYINWLRQGRSSV